MKRLPLHTTSHAQPASFPLAARMLLALCIMLGPTTATQLKADDGLPVAKIDRDEPVDFETEILPIFRRNCVACHNASEAESDLVVETPQAILTGGAEGPGVVPGKADESLLFQLAAHRRESFMPPEGNDVGAKNLTPEELRLLELWIDQGAKGDVASGAEAIAWQPLPPGFNPIYAIAVSPYGRFVAAGRANQIFMYSVPSQRELGRLTDPELLAEGVYEHPGVAHRDLVQSLAFSPSGDRLASGGFGSVKVWRQQNAAPQGSLPPAEADVLALAVSNDHRLAAVAQAEGTIQLYDTASGARLRTLDQLPTDVTSIAFSANGSRLVGSLVDQTVRLWNVADGQQVGQFATPAAVTAVALSHDGNQIITAEVDRLIRTWAVPEPNSSPPQPNQPESEVPQPLKELQGHTAKIVALAPVPNHPTQFVSASLDGTARHWDAAAGNEIRSLNHGGPLRSVAVRADGQRIATGSETGTTMLWNAQDGKQLAVLTTDAPEQDELDDIQLAIELARLHGRNAEGDLQAANQRQQAERENADKAVVDVVRLEFELKQKTEAATDAVAKKEAAQQELAVLEAERATLEAAKENADEQAKQQSEQKLTELTPKLNAAEQEALKLTAPADKAVEEKRNAEGAVDAAKRAVDRANDAVARVVAELPELERLRNERQQEQQAAEDRLAQAQQNTARRNASIRDLESRKTAADREAHDTQNRVRTAQETRETARRAVDEAWEAIRTHLAAGTLPDAAATNTRNQALGQLRNADNALGGAQAIVETATARLAQIEQQISEARIAVAAAEDDEAKAAQTAIVDYLAAQQAEAATLAAEATEQLNAATAQQLVAAEIFSAASSALDEAAAAASEAANDAQRLVKAATDAKAAADRAATEADAQSKATTMAKDATDAALTAAEDKLKQAEDDAAKAIAQVEVENATRNQAAADQKTTEAAAALAAAAEAKTAAETALTDAMNESKRIQEAANNSLAEAQGAFNEAKNQLAQADAAAGGLKAQTATAAQRKKAADAALAEVREPVRAVAFSRDGAQLAVVGASGQIQFYASESGAPLHQLTVSDRAFAAAAYIGDHRLLTAAEDHTLAIWASSPLWTFEQKIGSDDSSDQLTNRVTALDFSPSGQWLATGGGAPSRSGELKLWNVESGQLSRAIPEAHSDTVLSVKFSPDGKYIASCGADRFVRVFEVETGQLVKSYEGHTHHVLGVAWRADGRMLVTSGADNVIKVWDFVTGEQIRTITGFDKEITAVEFLGASDNFVVSTGNQQVMTRNTGGGGGPTFAGATDYVYDVSSSRNGKLVAAAGQDSVLRLWDQQGNAIVTFSPPSGSLQPATEDQAVVE